MTPQHEVLITAIAEVPGGDLAISGDELGTRIIWRRDGEPIVLAPVEVPRDDTRRSRGWAREHVAWIGVAPTGRIAASAHLGGLVALFDPRRGEPGPVLEVGRAQVPDGSWVHLEVAPAPEPPAPGHGNAHGIVVPPMFTEDGRRILTAGHSRDGGVIRLWDTRKGRAVATWTVDEVVSAVGFTAQGEPMAHAGGELVVLSDPPRFVAHELCGAEIRADGAVLVTGPGGQAWLDPLTGVAGPALTEPVSLSDDEPPLAVQVVDGRLELPPR